MDLEVDSNEVSSIIIGRIIDDIIEDIIPCDIDIAQEDQGKLNLRDQLISQLIHLVLGSQDITESLASALESLTEESAREILEEDKFDKMSKNTSQIIEQFSQGNTMEKGDYDLKLSGITIIHNARKEHVNDVHFRNHKIFRYRR